MTNETASTWVRVYPSTKKKINSNLKKAKVETQAEFIQKAVQYYWEENLQSYPQQVNR